VFDPETDDQWRTQARLELETLLARYYKLGDSGRIAEQAALFTPDGVVELHGQGVFQGRAAIVEAYQGLNHAHVADPTVTYIRHFSSNYTIELHSPTEARGDGYWLLLNDHGLDRWGRCRDWYRKQEHGPWQFTRRLVRADPCPSGPVSRDPLAPRV